MSVKALLIIVILSLLFLLSCQSEVVGSEGISSDELPKTVEPPAGMLIFADNNSNTNEQAISVGGISEEDAANLCRTILGETAEETGFMLAYRCVEIIEFEEQNYYVLTISWLVDDNHWSYIGEVMVSASGDEIYSGIVDLEGNYYLVEKLWGK